MTARIPRLSGDEWQNWANRVLCVHYGPLEYQQIPDNDRGDAGLEGFTRTDGHAYQAYGCEEPISTADRYERQRNKMTADLGKFILNRAALQRILGTVRITRWALFVPCFDSKEIVAHAARKTEEVKAAALPYVADSFHVCVCQQSDFAVEDQHLINSAQRQLLIAAESPTQDQIEDWAEENQGPSQVLSDKLRRLPTLRTDGERRKFQASVLDWYLKGQDILEELRLYPETYAKVRDAKAHREALLEMSMIGDVAPHELLMRTVNELYGSLKEEVRELHMHSAENLAYEAVADWLLRCPLRFPEVTHA